MISEAELTKINAARLLAGRPQLTQGDVARISQMRVPKDYGVDLATLLTVATTNPTHDYPHDGDGE